MGWGLGATDSFAWPPELDSRTAASKKANKKHELDDIFHDLDALRAEHAKLEKKIEFARKNLNAVKAKEWGQRAMTFASSSDVTKLVGSLKIVAKRAATTAAKPKISSDAKKALQAIAKASNDRAADFEPNKITRSISSIVHQLVEQDTQLVLGRMADVSKKFKNCADRGHPEIGQAQQLLKTWAANPAADDAKEALAVAGKLYDACRDMTQNISNLEKARAVGADLTALGLQPRDVETLPKLAKTLVPYAGGAQSAGKGKNRAQMDKIVKLVAVNAKLYDEIASHIH